MFWSKKKKEDFQLYEEELNHIQDLIEQRDEEGSDFEEGDLSIDLSEDMPENWDEEMEAEFSDSLEEAVLTGEEDSSPDENGKKEKGRLHFLKGLFRKKKSTAEEIPEETESPVDAVPEPELPADSVVTEGENVLENPDGAAGEEEADTSEIVPETAAEEPVIPKSVSGDAETPEEPDFPVEDQVEPIDQEEPDRAGEDKDQGPETVPGIRHETTSVSGGSGFGDEEITYVDDMDRKLPVKKIAAAVIAAAAVLAVVLSFVIRNLNSGGEGKVYVSSVREIMEFSGSSTGVLNRYTGVVASQDAWNISLDSNMTVAKCYVKVGQQVKVGDKLFKYNTDELKLNKEKLELDIQEKENANKTNQQTIEQSEKSLNSASASEKLELQTTLLKAQAEIKRNELDIKQDKKEIKKLEKTIKNATVKSKIDGVVKSLNESLGQGSDDESESENMAITEGNENSYYMVILAIGDYRIEGKISEQNQSDISEGERVIVRSRIDDTQIWKGVISEIKTNQTVKEDNAMDDFMGGEGTSGESSSYYNFYIDLDSDEGLMMGQHVLIEEDNNQDVTRKGIWLNSTYLSQEDGEFYVWIAGSNDKLEHKKVTVGDNYNADLDEYEIIDGLKKSDFIANASQTGLKSGMTCVKVSAEQTFIQTTEDPFAETETSDGEDYLDDFGGLEDINEIENEEDLQQLEDNYNNYDGIDSDVQFEGDDSVVEGDGPVGQDGVIIDSGELDKSQQ